jgi:hypothetical protein
MPFALLCSGTFRGRLKIIFCSPAGSSLSDGIQNMDKHSTTLVTVWYYYFAFR